MASEEIELAQDIDFLGDLATKLCDLQGWATLAYEQIQNADDTVGATQIRFDVTDEALVIWNDGTFSDCGCVREVSCAFEQQQRGRLCDFHAFRRIASGHKRLELGTTGAFGIGFISVYQVTDHPVLRSGRWRWRLDPSATPASRIKATETEVPLEATEFTLPWAREESPIRAGLRREPVPQDVVQSMSAQLAAALPRAAPFLKRLTRLELRINGTVALEVCCTRDAERNEIRVNENGVERVWKCFSADFHAAADEVRRRHPGRIEDKRKSLVTIAVPMEALPESGLLYASLPTEQQLALPILVNADFYPSLNRKLVALGDDFQGEWNRLGIQAAAQALVEALPELRDTMTPGDLWRMLTLAHQLARDAAGKVVDPSFVHFWTLIKPRLQAGAFVRSSTGVWCAPATIKFNRDGPDAESCLPLLESLGLQIVHQDLKAHYNVLREIGTGLLDLDDLTQALLSAGLDKPLDMRAVPPWLQEATNRRTLAQALEEAFTSGMARQRQLAARERLVRCSLWPTQDGRLAPAAMLWRGEAETRKLFAALVSPGRWLADDVPASWADMVHVFDLTTAVNLLETAGAQALARHHAASPGWLHGLIAWIDLRRGEIAHNPTLRERLRQLAIWPCGDRLHDLNTLAVPGDFVDPLGLANVLQGDTAERFRSLLVDHLQARSLSLRHYLMEQVPAAFAGQHVPDGPTRQELLRLIAERIGVLREAADVRGRLQTLALVLCEDGTHRAPHTAYFRSSTLELLLGDAAGRYVHGLLLQSAGVEEALAWLGVQSIAAPRDIVQRVRLLMERRDKEGIGKVFSGLVEGWPQLHVRRAELAELRNMAWMPVDKLPHWALPTRACARFSRMLFESQGAFLDVPLVDERRASTNEPIARGESTLGFLGVQVHPTCAQVVAHLLHEAKAGRVVHDGVYRFLDDNAGEQPVQRLRNEPCLHIGSGRYIRPAQAFRFAHRFGKYRHRLGSGLLARARLLDALQVAEQPGAADAAAVLMEMAEQFRHVQQLAPEDVEINTLCWTLLAIAGESVDDRTFDQLARSTVVPSRNRFLRRPDGVFFEDRPGLAEKFPGDVVQSATIVRPEGAWPAMARAGVKDLSKVVQTRVVDFQPVEDSGFWSQLLQDRWPLVRRVMASATAAQRDVLLHEPPPVQEVAGLTLDHRFQELMTEAEPVAAFVDPASRVLYVSRDRRGAEAAVARELALLLQPDSTAAPLAATFREVLRGGSAQEAQEVLTELGFAAVELGHVVEDGGDDLAPAHEDVVPVDGASGEQLDEGPTEPTSLFTVTPPAQDEEGLSSPTAGSGSPPLRDLPTTSSEPAGNQDTGPVSEGTGPVGRTVPPGRSRGAEKLPVGARDQAVQRQGKLILRSYVEPYWEGSDGNSASAEAPGNARELEVDAKGTARVMAFEKEQHRVPVKMEHFHPGYDVESRDEHGNVLRYIEVKTLSGRWDLFSVGLSATQVATAREKGAQYWLYVVENVESASPRLHCIQDPVNRISDYRFDDGWCHAAESHPAPVPEAAPVAPSGKRSIFDARPPLQDETNKGQTLVAGN